MHNFTKSLLLSAVMLMTAMTASAQLSANPDKFLGNITTDWTYMDYNGFKFSDYWNQTTPENATKWGIVEGTRGTYHWQNADVAYTYASNKGFPFKFHTLVWGSQYPDWMNSLSKEEQLKAIEKWMDAVKAHYPNLEMIDVVNEAVAGHAPAPYKDALGGDGVSGFDWIIKSFEMAAERWPDAILIYNDYNTFQNQVTEFIQLVKVLRDAGAPIDAYGCQSHELGGMTATSFGSVMQSIQNELKIPMYITEYDIADTNDGNQTWNYQQHIPLMWEADYCAGVTLWGWFYGKTWTDGGKGYSGLIKDGAERPALTWLRQYMQTEKAKTAKSPFPGMKKEASLYVKPSAVKVSVGVPMTIDVNVRMRTKSIQQVQLYVENTLEETMTSAPYTVTYRPTTAKYYDLKAVVTTTDGTKYERPGGFTAVEGFIPQPGVVAAVGTRYGSLSEIGSKPFAIVNEEEGKALYGINDQNLGYADFATAFTSGVSGFLFKLEKVGSYYRLRLITPSGSEYSVWGEPGYLNSQPDEAGKWCSFILGLNNQNGKDFANGALWDIQYVSGKGFTMRNVGTGKYLKNNDVAKYSEPTYFTFCTLAASTETAINERMVEGDRWRVEGDAWYTLDGRKLQDTPTQHGIYIIKGKKVKK